MPKLGGSRYADLTEQQGVNPVYWQITNKSPYSRQVGWEILKLNVTGKAKMYNNALPLNA